MRKTMSKNKKVSKVLVRNPSVPLRSSKAPAKAQIPKKVHFSESASTEENQTLTGPTFCTLLQLADELNAIRQTQTTSRSLPESSRHRNLNFLPEDRIYQDLVDLEVPVGEPANEVRSQPCVKLKKDPEPDISKHTKYELEPEYFFTSYAEPVIKKQVISFDQIGRSIYNNLSLWEQDEE